MNRIFNVLKGKKRGRSYVVIEDLRKLKKIYNPVWKDKNNSPYEALTQLVDSYEYLVERPDLSFLFIWQAINNSYNELIFKDSTKKKYQDTAGIKILIDKIKISQNIYEDLLNEFLNKIPTKLYKYVSSYILKGYVISKKVSEDPKYKTSSYTTFIKKFNKLNKIIEKTFGEEYLKNSNPTIQGKYIEIGGDKNNSRIVVHTLALKLKELIEVGKTTIKDKDDNSFEIEFTFEEKLEFLIFQILYSSRCTNAHGNVASRLNSVHTKQSSYNSYVYVCLSAYALLSICFHINGYIDDNILDTLKKNNKFLDYCN